jgi:hypothetical protein
MNQTVTFPIQRELEQFKTLTIVVMSPETELEARTHLSLMRSAGKRLEADIKALKAPHQAAVKEIDEAARPWKNLLAERDTSLEQALLKYGQQVRVAAEAANRKILEKYENKVALTEAKAIAQGKPIPVVLPPLTVNAPPNSVGVAGSQQTIVRRKAWRITGTNNPDELTRASFASKSVPDEYFTLDTARIGKVVRAGGSIPGVEIFEEESIAVRAQR